MTQEERLQLLARASEIEQQAQVNLDRNIEASELVAAAEETGLSREAVLQALRERLSLTEVILKQGDLVFAKSVDRFLYPARITGIMDGVLEIEFLSGGKSVLPRHQVFAFQAIPGQVLNCPWPDWGWWNCRVLRYDAVQEIVYVTDGWGEQNQFPISQVRVKQDSELQTTRRDQILYYAGVAIGSGVLGAILMRLFTH